MNDFVLFSGSSNRLLAGKIAKELNIRLGKLEIGAFPNKELRIRMLEDVKDKTVFVFQSTAQLAERYLVELALIADAAKRGQAEKVIAIISWLGYSPQDKVFRKGEPLSIEIIIKMLEATSIGEFVVLDIHSQKILNIFSKKVYHLTAMPVFIDFFQGKLGADWCTVALDKGAVERAGKFAKALSLPLVKFDKSRDRQTGDVVFHKLMGESVEGKKIISFDDFISTGGTRIKGCEFLKNRGAVKYYDCTTHLIVPETTERLNKSKIDRMFITDSVDLDAKFYFKRLKIVTVAPLIAKFIQDYMNSKVS